MSKESPSEETSEKGWSLRLDANPLSKEETCPAPAHFFREPAWKADGEFLRKVSAAHWRHLVQSLNGKIEQGNVFSFSLLERLFFDWGVWCGEQLAGDPTVKEVLEENPETERRELFKLIFEEVAEFCKTDLAFAEGISGLTGWLSNRDESYRLIAEAERFTLTREAFPMLPPECSEYFRLRDGRIQCCAQLKTRLEKLPGLSENLVALIAGGALFDEFDFLRSNPRLNAEQTRKLNKLDAMWSKVRQTYTMFFEDETSQALLAQLEALTQQIINTCKAQKVDVSKIRELARESFREERQTLKRISRDIQLIRNNLNVASMRKSQRPHNPLALSWPNPMERAKLLASFQRLRELDSFYPTRSWILLAPGAFDGFFEIDRETLILPLYAQGQELDQAISALSDYRISIETIRSNQEFLDALKLLHPGEPPKTCFARLYRHWIEAGGSGEAQAFEARDLEFLLKYVAPSPRTLFLLRDEVVVDLHTRTRILAEAEKQVLTAQQMHQIAALHYVKGDLQSAFKWISRTIKARADHAIYEVSLVVILARLGRGADALKVLERWSDRKEYGCIRFFVTPMLNRLRTA